MVSGNKKKRKNNRNNKKNRVKRDNNAIQSARAPVNKEDNINESVDNELDQQITSKRNHSEDSSDNEDEPKKKKKKKQPVPTDSKDNKGKKSIRQLKREKHAQRQAEEAAASKDQLKSQCVSYLSQWKHDRQNWKFMKIKQVWLYKNKFSSYLLPDSSWPALLEYFESAKGNVRNLLLEDANKVIQQMDEWTESQNNTEKNTQKDGDNEEDDENDKTEGPKKPDDTAYKRARDLIQCLQE